MINQLRDAVDAARKDAGRGSLTVVMEDDFLARVYYHLLAGAFGDLSGRTFLKTRILQDNPTLPARNRYDLVIGDPRDVTVDGETVRDVTPRLVAEFKVFPVGFSDQQLSKRRDGIGDDIRKLALVGQQTPGQVIELAVVFFDDRNWLDGTNQYASLTRMEEFVRTRDSASNAIRIIGVLRGELVER